MTRYMYYIVMTIIILLLTLVQQNVNLPHRRFYLLCSALTCPRLVIHPVGTSARTCPG